jgi:hypothetical protein
MTPEQYLNDLASDVSLGLGENERELIERKQNALREGLRLDNGIDLVDDFLTGSYRRHTIIMPKGTDETFDVDVFVAFDHEEYGERNLAEIRDTTVGALRRLRDGHPELAIKVLNVDQARSVGVEFDANFQIDIVPAIQIVKDERYKIFDKRTGEAVISNPKLHGRLLTEANDRTASGTVKRLVPIIKILKAWKREKCDYVKSFHIEILAVKILGNEEIGSYSKGVSKFLLEASDHLSRACLLDPANSELLIDRYLDKDGNREALQVLVECEAVKAEKARDYEDGGDTEKAVQEWQKILAAEAGKQPRPLPQVTIGVTPPKPHAW